MKYLASIIIPTMFSNVDYLRDCLISLQQLRFDKSIEQPKIAALVVCNTTAEEMTRVQQSIDSKLTSPNHYKLDINWLAMGYNTGFVGATNAGIKAAQSEYVVFLNDDTQVTAQWLSELVLTQRQTLADMVASTVYLGDRSTLDSQGFGFAWRGKAEALTSGAKCTLSSDRDYWLAQPELLPDSRMAEPFGPDGAAAMYTQKLLSKVGLLEQDFFAYLEDVDLALRARQHGMFCALSEQAVIYHYKHATSSKFSSFKSKQDLINWGKIVTRRFSPTVWARFWTLILIERIRNFSGYIKSIR